jgi:hypothetical protein
VQYSKYKHHSGYNEPQAFSSYLDMADSFDRSIYYWWQVLELLGDDTILERQLKLLPGNSGIDSSDSQSILRSLQAADTMPHRGTHAETSGTGSSSGSKGGTKQLLQAIGNLQKKIDESEEKEKDYVQQVQASVVMANHDRAQEKLEKLGDKIRELHRCDKKRKGYILQYKHSFAEYVALERQVSKAMNIEYDPEIENDDASFLEDADTSDSSLDESEVQHDKYSSSKYVRSL